MSEMDADEVLSDVEAQEETLQIVEEDAKVQYPWGPAPERT